MTTDNEALPPLEQQIDEYIDGYTLEGDDSYYQPNYTERLIAKDVVMGLMAEPWFVAALSASPQAPQLRYTFWTGDGEAAMQPDPNGNWLWIGDTAKAPKGL